VNKAVPKDVLIADLRRRKIQAVFRGQDGMVAILEARIQELETKDA